MFSRDIFEYVDQPERLSAHSARRVVQREPPTLKAWKTVGEPHLLVIGRYRMMVSIKARKDGSRVVIAIDYAFTVGWARVRARQAFRTDVRTLVRRADDPGSGPSGRSARSMRLALECQ